MNSTTKNTLIESVKIVAGMVAVVSATLLGWFAISQVYLALGFEEFKSEFWAWVTLVTPLVLYGFGAVVWSEAKLRVWKRENNVE